MILTVERFQRAETCTIGHLLIDGEQSCYTLEDAVREQPGVPVEQWKVPGKTAIPTGTYQVIIDMSSRFKRRMPHLLNVPGFDGIRIHSGNTDQDTEGCILLGQTWDQAKPDFIGNSRAAFDDFFTRLDEACAQGDVYLTVESAESPESLPVT